LDKQTILKAAVTLAETRGYDNVYKRNISQVLGCGMGTVNYHWGTMKELRTAIVQEGVRTNNKRILMQALAVNHHAIRHLTANQRAQAVTE
jgi:AcrR family transcriptional regulator